MIAHLAISMAHLVLALADLCKRVQPVQAIFIGEINVVTPIAARCEVVKGASEFESEGAGYDGEKVNTGNVIMKDLTPAVVTPAVLFETAHNCVSTGFGATKRVVESSVNPKIFS